MEENKKVNADDFTIYELAKIIDENITTNNSERPKPFEDEGAYAEDDD